MDESRHAAAGQLFVLSTAAHEREREKGYPMEDDSTLGCPFAASLRHEEPQPLASHSAHRDPGAVLPIGVDRVRKQPERFEPIPVARGQGSGVPGMEGLLLLRGLLKDPAAQLDVYRQRYGNIFSYPVRPLYDEVFYVFSLDAYKKLLDVSPEDGLKAGPVRALIPTLGKWFPRSDSDPDYVEKLVVSGRAFIGSLLKERLPLVESIVERTVRSTVARWSGEIDLSRELVDLVYDCSARAVVGDEVWEHIGAVARPALRRIARGIEIPRIVLGLSPLGRLTPEHRAVKDLYRAIQDLQAAHRRTGAYPILDRIAEIEIDGRRLPAGDVPWILHYILWSAVTYPGTYGFWGFVDILTRPKVLSALREAAPGERVRLIRHCLTETMRLHPVITLARMTTRPLEVECDGRWYRIPANRIVIVTPYAFNSDPERFETPREYNPWRYDEGAPSAHVFGRGAYGCVAQNYVYTLLGAVFSEVLERRTFRSAEATVPSRKCNVHLVYPLQPFHARVDPMRSHSA